MYINALSSGLFSHSKMRFASNSNEGPFLGDARVYRALLEKYYNNGTRVTVDESIPGSYIGPRIMPTAAEIAEANVAYNEQHSTPLSPPHPTIKSRIAEIRPVLMRPLKNNFERLKQAIGGHPLQRLLQRIKHPFHRPKQAV